MAAFAIAAIAATSCGNRSDVQVQTADVTSGPIARRVLVSGTLEPTRMVNVGSQVSGTIAALEVDFNARVKKGRVLARLDPLSFHTRLAEAEGGVAKARGEHARLRAALDDARRKLDDARTLAGGDQLARAELDAARTAVLQAEADVRGATAGIAAAQAELAQARVNLDRTVIRSPIDGVVIARHVDVGQTIAAAVNAPVLFTIGDLRKMRLLAEVPEGEVGGVQRGEHVRFEIESIGRDAFTGTVAEVRLGPVIEPAPASSAGATTSPSPVATSGSSSSPAPAASSSGSAAGSNTSASTSPSAPAASAPAAGGSSAQASASSTGVVTYVAVIDVDNPGMQIPPGSTAIVTLASAERPKAVRIPNNALTFAPSAEAFAAIGQKPPALNRAASAAKPKSGTRRGYVWKFENRRFVPIAVETGVADDSWTELIGGEVHPQDRLVTAAVVSAR